MIGKRACGRASSGSSTPSATAGWVGAAHGQVQAFQRGLLVGEVPAGSGRSAHPGVQRLDGVGGWRSPGGSRVSSRGTAANAVQLCSHLSPRNHRRALPVFGSKEVKSGRNVLGFPNGHLTRSRTDGEGSALQLVPLGSGAASADTSPAGLRRRPPMLSSPLRPCHIGASREPRRGGRSRAHQPPPRAVLLPRSGDYIRLRCNSKPSQA